MITASPWGCSSAGGELDHVVALRQGARGHQQMPVAERSDAMRVHHRWHVRNGDKYPEPVLLRSTAQETHHLLTLEHVKVCRWIVDDQQARLPHHRVSDRDECALAVGQILPAPFRAFAHADT